MPIRTRLTLAFTAVLAVMFAGAGLSLVLAMRGQLETAVDAGLLSRAQVISSSADPVGSVSGGTLLIDADEAFAQILGAEGRVEEVSNRLPREPLLEPGRIADLSAPEFFDTDVDISGETLPARLLAAPLAGGRVLIVGASVEDQREAVALLSGLLLLGGPAMVALGAVLIRRVTGAALGPVERMRDEADAISVSESGRLLTVGNSGDEITRLASSFNGLLARLGDALQSERRLVNQASHELRTPIARMTSELELALSGPQDLHEQAEALRRVLEDARDLGRLTEDLLVLARANGGALPIRREPVELERLVDEAFAACAQAASSRGMQLTATASGTYRMDPVRIRQVLNNLLDNAIKYGGPGRVEVAASPEGSDLVLAVRNPGPGLAPELLCGAIRPFTRPALTDNPRPEGAGLGLSIVRAIVEAHGGTLDLSNPGAGGAEVTIRIPGVAGS